MKAHIPELSSFVEIPGRPAAVEVADAVEDTRVLATNPVLVVSVILKSLCRMSGYWQIWPVIHIHDRRERGTLDQMILGLVMEQRMCKSISVATNKEEN